MTESNSEQMGESLTQDSHSPEEEHSERHKKEPLSESNESKPVPAFIEEKSSHSFYWYDRDPQLYAAEVEAMRTFFPEFQMEKLADGRLSWHGVIEPKLRSRGKWYLQAVYENNHPNNSTFGGSVKVYSVEPDLKEFINQLGSIPHLLRDSRGEPYLCTFVADEFKASASHSTTAAAVVARAAKWIAVFELWLSGEVSTQEFEGTESLGG
jgi:hypothetical protein